MRQLQMSEAAYELLGQLVQSEQVSLPLCHAQTAVELQESVEEAQTIAEDADDDGPVSE